MITEISPIFGLSLLELLEVATIAIPFAIAGSAIGTGFFSYRSIQQSKKQLTAQLERQSKIDSARLLTDLREHLKRQGFAGITYKLYKGWLDDDDDELVERYLNHLDMIAVYWEDGLLEKRHIKEVLGGLFLKVKKDDYIQNAMKERKDLYKPLKRLCDSL